MAKVLEFGSMLFLGILLVLAFTHLLNGTFSQWISSKFTTHDLTATTKSGSGLSSEEESHHGGGQTNKLE